MKPETRQVEKAIFLNKTAAIFIDAENINSYGFRSFCSSFQKRFCKIRTIKAFGDWREDPNDWQSVYQDLGIELIHNQPLVIGKNSTDIKMIIAIKNFFEQNPNVGVCCIVSADSDFTNLVLDLREKGIYTIVAGGENLVYGYQQAADKFILLKQPEIQLQGNLLKIVQLAIINHLDENGNAHYSKVFKYLEDKIDLKSFGCHNFIQFLNLSAISRMIEVVSIDGEKYYRFRKPKKLSLALVSMKIKSKWESTMPVFYHFFNSLKSFFSIKKKEVYVDEKKIFSPEKTLDILRQIVALHKEHLDNNNFKDVYNTYRYWARIKKFTRGDYYKDFMPVVRNEQNFSLTYSKNNILTIDNVSPVVIQIGVREPIERYFRQVYVKNMSQEDEFSENDTEEVIFEGESQVLQEKKQKKQPEIIKKYQNEVKIEEKSFDNLQDEQKEVIFEEKNTQFEEEISEMQENQIAFGQEEVFDTEILDLEKEEFSDFDEDLEETLTIEDNAHWLFEYVVDNQPYSDDDEYLDFFETYKAYLNHLRTTNQQDVKISEFVTLLTVDCLPFFDFRIDNKEFTGVRTKQNVNFYNDFFYINSENFPYPDTETAFDVFKKVLEDQNVQNHWTNFSLLYKYFCYECKKSGIKPYDFMEFLPFFSTYQPNFDLKYRDGIIEQVKLKEGINFSKDDLIISKDILRLSSEEKFEILKETIIVCEITTDKMHIDDFYHRFEEICEKRVIKTTFLNFLDVIYENIVYFSYEKDVETGKIVYTSVRKGADFKNLVYKSSPELLTDTEKLQIIQKTILDDNQIEEEFVEIKSFITNCIRKSNAILNKNVSFKEIFDFLLDAKISQNFSLKNDEIEGRVTHLKFKNAITAQSFLLKKTK